MGVVRVLGVPSLFIVMWYVLLYGARLHVSQNTPACFIGVLLVFRLSLPPFFFTEIKKKLLGITRYNCLMWPQYWSPCSLMHLH